MRHARIRLLFDLRAGRAQSRGEAGRIAGIDGRILIAGREKHRGRRAARKIDRLRRDEVFLGLAVEGGDRRVHAERQEIVWAGKRSGRAHRIGVQSRLPQIMRVQ